MIKRFSWVVAASWAALAAVACDQSGGSGAQATSDGEQAAKAAGSGAATSAAASKSGTGIAECDAYLKTLERCVKNSPAEARAAQEQALEMARKAYSNANVPAAVRGSWPAQCKQANDLLAQNPFCQDKGGAAAAATSSAAADAVVPAAAGTASPGAAS
ncbi:MAG: hypothetical protein JRI55_32530, partial [Deltaproteobacteria bacterium]|nr:hypothetical protein [Deltaproteobacteria bacterium]